MRGLVLGAGGFTGIAWQIGMIAGLREQGIDLAKAELVVGTSAGSITGALVASGFDMSQAAALELAAPADEAAIKIDWARGTLAYQILNDSSLDEAEIRRRVGALALEADVADENVFVEMISQRLLVAEWPPGLRITAVRARDGEPVIWQGDVPLELATAASCAVPCVFPPVTIDGERYIDGGVRSGTNADLAAGCESVVALAPLAPVRMRGAPQAEFDLLRACGAKVSLVSPDETAIEALGPNVFDWERWVPGISAGREQARREGEQIGEIWA